MKGDAFFGTPSFGTKGAYPLVLMRRRTPTCFEEQCGHGWELSQMDGEGLKTFRIGHMVGRNATVICHQLSRLLLGVY